MTLVKTQNYKLIERKKQILTTSRSVAETFEKEHKNVVRDIEKLECSEEFNKHNFERIKYKDSRNREQMEYLMTRDGFTFIAMGFTGKKAAEFKEGYIKQFNKMESILLEKQSVEWQQARLQSKSFHKELTDVIKTFTEYAEEQGSKSPNMYYIHFAKLINKALGIDANEIDSTNQITLRNKTILIEVIEKELVDNMNTKMFYKEIFKNCKIKVEQLINFIPSLNK